MTPALRTELCLTALRALHPPPPPLAPAAVAAARARDAAAGSPPGGARARADPLSRLLAALSGDADAWAARRQRVVVETASAGESGATRECEAPGDPLQARRAGAVARGGATASPRSRRLSKPW